MMAGERLFISGVNVYPEQVRQLCIGEHPAHLAGRGQVSGGTFAEPRPEVFQAG